MFSRVSALITVAIAAAACARMERHTRRTNSFSQCDTGSIHCCNNVMNATEIASVLSAFGYSYEPTDSVGINCTPVNVMGAGQAAGCQQQPVCCANDEQNGFFNVGCSPTTLN